MKNKVLITILFAALAFTQFSCQKEWICTCSAQSTIAGQNNIDILDTIPSAVKPAAQADCNRFCSTYLNQPGYTNPSASIVKH